MSFLLLALVLTGCATDPEKLLVGKWKADASQVGMTMKAVKLKVDNPDATNKQVLDAAKAFASIALELKADKSCAFLMGGNVLKGTWSFDKALNEVQLDLKTAEAAAENKDQNPESFKPQTWVAYLDADEPKLSVYMGDREAVDMIKKMSKKEGAGAIVLRK